MKTAKQSIDLEYKGTKKRLNLRTALISLCMFAFVGTSAQTGTVTVKLRNASVKELFSAIEKQTSYRFSYRDAEIKGKGNVTISATNRELKQLLEGELSKLGLKYAVSGNKIIVTPAAVAPSAQPKKVTGKVVDANGEPVIGATVKEQGTANGTITDFDGNFTLDVTDNAMLEVSYIGYKSQELKAVAGKMLSVTLSEDTEVLDEVVVVGYGVQKKSTLTGAISSVKADELVATSDASIGQLLKGKAAGVTILSTSAQPGGGLDIRIRGASSTGAGNEPLFVIDGFPISGSSLEPGGTGWYDSGSRNPLNSLNPNDIESIEILKDASSTAIYGARASNGVVLITTKRGKQGIKFNYDANITTQKISNPFDVLNAHDFMVESNKMIKEKWMRDNGVYPYGNNDPSSIGSSWTPKYTDEQIAEAGEGTDWWDLVTRTGIVHNHNISMTYGNDKIRSYASLGYFKNEGVVENSSLERFTAKINLDWNINKFLSTGVSYLGSRISTYISLLQNYINDSNTDVAYYIIEINNRNKGENIDKESRLFKRLFCLENYGKINALYYSLPLGLYNHESYFESLLYIKTNDNISQISKETYIDLVKAIYFDYYLFWYQPFMSNNEYIEYKKKVERVYQLVIQDVMNEMFCDISYVDCPLFHESGYIQPNTTLPVITRPQKKYLFLVVPGFIACTILIVWI